MIYLVVGREPMAPEALGIYGSEGYVLVDCVDTRMRIFTTEDAAEKYAEENRPSALWMVHSDERAEFVARFD